MDIPLNRLVRGENIREVKGEDVGELMMSISNKGQLQPLLVVPAGGGRYRVVFGFRRFMALELLNAPTAWCELRKDITPKDEPILQLIENTQRRDMDPEELVKVFDRLKKSGMGDKQIAAELDRSPGWVWDQYLTVRTREEQRAAGKLSEEEIRKINVSRAIKMLTLKNRGDAPFVIERSGHFSLRIICRDEEVLKKLRSKLFGFLGHMTGGRGEKKHARAS
jgi:ParB/RepB/Spo0J family partition protein